MKKILSIMLSVLMVFSLVSVRIHAEGAVAKIGDVEYETLDEAVSVAESGSTITILQDCQLTKIVNKDLTFTGNGKISMSNYTYNNGFNKTWVFDGTNLSFEWENSSGGWLMFATSGIIKADNGATVTFKFDSTTGANCAFYMNEGAEIVVDNGSTFNILGTNTKDISGQAIQLDKTGKANITVKNNSTFLIDGTNRGYVNSPVIVVENSIFTVQNCTSNASNGGWNYYDNATVSYLNNNGHGISADLVSSKDSTIISNNNRYYGIASTENELVNTTVVVENNGYNGYMARKTITTANCDITVKHNGYYSDNDTYAGLQFGTSSIVCYPVIDKDTKLHVTENAGNGIRFNNVSTGTIESTDFVVTNNLAKVGCNGTGGGIAVLKGTITIPDTAIVYNNHAYKAGDDIYVASNASLTFGGVGSDWSLDGTEGTNDCTEAITGWFDDSASSRWNAHEENGSLHLMLLKSTGTTTITGVKSLKAAHGIYGTNEMPEAPQIDASKSKTATNLDDDYVTEITLSLPSETFKKTIDVAFALDGSTSTDAALIVEQASTMLKALANGFENINVNASVTIFGGAWPILDTTETVVDIKNEDNLNKLISLLTTTDWNSKKDDYGTKVRSGSNVQAGIDKAAEILAKDTSVDDSDKYLIVLSDLGARMWTSEDGKAMSVGYIANEGTNESGIRWNSSDDFDKKYVNNGYIPDVDYLMSMDEETVNSTSYSYEDYLVVKANNDKESFKGNGVWADINNLTTREVAVYHAGKAITNAMQDYNVILVSYPYASGIYTKFTNSFSDWLVGKGLNRYDSSIMNEADIFENIKNELLYVVDAGSRVEDYMGYAEGDYDFDFINDAKEIHLTVGGVEFETVQLSENEYGFRAPNAEEFSYKLSYTKGNGAKEEHFVLTINVPVLKNEQVQLKYKEVLTNPKDTAGSYGVYDEDGSNHENGLFTNKRATLYPVDSLGNEGESEDFGMPTVSYELVSVSVTKVWKDAENQDGVRPEEIIIELLANGESVARKKTTAKENWSLEFDGLPKFAKGKEIVYSVEEVKVDGYESESSNKDLVFTVTNTHTPATTSVTVTKTWDDADNQDGLRDSYGVTLYANGKEYRDEVTLKADELTYTWSNLPVNADGKKIEYTVVETTVPEGYKSTVEGFKITNTHTPATTEVTVTKTWSDSDDQDGLRGTYGVTLYADGTAVGKEVTLESDELTYTWRGLPVNANGKKITYTVKETTVPEGYEASVEGLTITNTHEAETTELTVTKVWVDADNKDKLRPESVKVTVYADGKELTTVELSEENKWTVTVEDLPVYADGKEVVYSVSEEEVEEYETEIESEGLKFTVTNVHVIVPDTDPDDPEPTPEPTPTPVPDTGDAVNLVALYSMMASSAAGIVVAKALRKKYED